MYRCPAGVSATWTYSTRTVVLGWRYREEGADPLAAWAPDAAAIVAQLDDLQRRKKNGKVALPDGDTLDVTNLDKVFWPRGRRTKGDLLRYYTQIAPLLLPETPARGEQE